MHNFQSFRDMVSFVKALLVCNDPAERGIKLVFDYANVLTIDSQDRESLLQAVEFHRRMFQDVTKPTLSKSLPSAVVTSRNLK